MSNIDPQNVQQIVQLLATYGTPAGIAAAQAVGTGAVQALGSGATKAIKSLWGKIRHKSKQEGGIAQDAVFALEIAQLFDVVQRDPLAKQFIQHISGNAQVGIAGVNYGPVNIHQTA